MYYLLDDNDKFVGCQITVQTGIKFTTKTPPPGFRRDNSHEISFDFTNDVWTGTLITGWQLNANGIPEKSISTIRTAKEKEISTLINEYVASIIDGGVTLTLPVQGGAYTFQTKPDSRESLNGAVTLIASGETMSGKWITSSNETITGLASADYIAIGKAMRDLKESSVMKGRVMKDALPSLTDQELIDYNVVERFSQAIG